MKKIFILTSLLLALNSTTAQDCQNPVSNNVYQSAFNQVAAQSSNQKKADKAIEFVNANCLTSTQVKNMAVLFSEDGYRLDFCKAAYLRTFDRVNFFDVYDAFTSFSYALRLYDYTKSQGKGSPINPALNLITPTNTTTANNNTNTNTNTGNPPPKTSQQTEPVYPNYIYPILMQYKGKKGCAGPIMDEAIFKQLGKNVFNQTTDEAKNLAIQSAAEQNCLSTSQIMRLTSLIKNESLRLKTLTGTFPKTYDQDNYKSSSVLLSEKAQKDEWEKFAHTYLNPQLAVCAVNDADFSAIMTSIKAKSFPNEKLQLVDVFANDLCFSVAQIKTISKEFPMGKDKLTAMKKLYPKCADQANYYQLTDELTFAPDREELTTFIKNKGK
jgi:hypothetical protein